MLIATWIINGLLALAFLGAGGMKLVRSRPQLATAGLAWVEDVSDPGVKAIGLLEVLAAIGLVLPLATGIAPVLTPLAAVGAAILMVGASVVHVRRHEPPVPAAVLGALAIASAVLGFLVVA